MRLHIRHDNRCTKVAQTRSHGTDDRDVAITSKLWDIRIVVLKHAERQREAYVEHVSGRSMILVQSFDNSLPHSKASNTKAATSNLQAAGPPSVGASCCPVSSPCTIPSAILFGRDGGGLSSASEEVASTGREFVAGVNSMFSVGHGIIATEM